jgi:hypothetical protein
MSYLDEATLPVLDALQLADSIRELGGMAPVDRARAVPALIDACRTLQGDLSAIRKTAMEEATTGAWKLSRAELGRELGLSKSKVTELLGAKPKPEAVLVREG